MASSGSSRLGAHATGADCCFCPDGVFGDMLVVGVNPRRLIRLGAIQAPGAYPVRSTVLMLVL